MFVCDSDCHGVVMKALIREEGLKCRSKSVQFSLDCGWNIEGSAAVRCEVPFGVSSTAQL